VSSKSFRPRHLQQRGRTQPSEKRVAPAPVSMSSVIADFGRVRSGSFAVLSRGNLSYHSGMSEQVPRRRISPFIAWPLCLLVLWVLYLASLGPVSWLLVHDKISIETYMRLSQTIYFPIQWVAENTHFLENNPMGRAYLSYVVWVAGPLMPEVSF